MVIVQSAMSMLDDLDRRLIDVLRRDGRAPLSKLAVILGVSRGTAQARLDRLLESGTVLGFTIRVRQDQEPHVIRAIMMIEVAGKSTSAVIQNLRRIPELHTLHSTNGAWDLVAEIRASSLQDFDRVLGEVRMSDGILNSETSILLSSF